MPHRPATVIGEPSLPPFGAVDHLDPLVTHADASGRRAFFVTELPADPSAIIMDDTLHHHRFEQCDLNRLLTGFTRLVHLSFYSSCKITASVAGRWGRG